MRMICFLSDFGLADDFVGTCKGVMLKISPGAQILDLTHQVPNFAIEAGAEILQHATRYMPGEAVYLAVVDPGVGTDRREIALETSSGAVMVGPDNGLLIPAAEALGGVSSAVELTNEEYKIHPVSNTFHGRDVFSPAAAHLASGVALPELGKEIPLDSLAQLAIEEDVVRDGDITARVIDIDRFGNARLSVREESSGLRYGDEMKLDIGDGDMSVRYVATFGAAGAGELILVPDSHWRLSVSINKGSAAHALSLSVGTKVRLKR
jgi:S-adenosyl-L-methionine hydrolase (adenosine-forming)